MECEVSGEAQLCITKDRSWFQGHLVTDDDGQFTITGNRYEESSDVSDESSDTYRVKVHDHEQCLSYVLDRVEKARKSIFCLDSKQMKFECQNRYRGQRADIVIQRFIPDLVGRDLDVFVGQMKIVLQQKPLIPYPTWKC